MVTGWFLFWYSAFTPLIHWFPPPHLFVQICSSFEELCSTCSFPTWMTVYFFHLSWTLYLPPFSQAELRSSWTSSPSVVPAPCSSFWFGQTYYQEKHYKLWLVCVWEACLESNMHISGFVLPSIKQSILQQQDPGVPFTSGCSSGLRPNLFWLVVLSSKPF